LSSLKILTREDKLEWLQGEWEERKRRNGKRRSAKLSRLFILDRGECTKHHLEILCIKRNFILNEK
jgi:hypothetical protein